MMIREGREDGTLAKIVWQSGKEVRFREGVHAGPSLWVWPKGDQEPIHILLTQDEHGFEGQYEGTRFTLVYNQQAEGLELDVTLDQEVGLFEPKRCELRLGIDTYMEKFPDWDACHFPTTMRCEKTHAWGYMMSPTGESVVIASRDPIAAWHNLYTRAQYDPVYTDTGHRIDTMSLDLMNEGPLPARHPEGLHRLEVGEQRCFRILLAPADTEDQIHQIVSMYTGAPTVNMTKYTYEFGECAEARSEAKLMYHAPSGKKYEGTQAGVVLDEYGCWRVIAECGDKISEAMIYVRKPWSYYLEKAREAALTYEQKAATHTESWYGFFSAFLARKHMPDSALDERLEAKFNEVFGVMHHMDTIKPVDAALPWRIQNSALMISVLVDAYEATDKRHYLEWARSLAELIMGYQSEDGVYRCHGVHYTCVIYIAKAMLELYQVEQSLEGEVWQEAAALHYTSAKRAIDELERSRDDIQTEGEMTFEDGMISCSSLQLGMFALMLDEETRKPYTEAAAYMLDKHRCLEMTQIPDCRMRGATLRFWESMYDVMIPQGMMTSPHGWTSWKNYASYYLYRLTGKKQYLVELMDTLGACMQTIDIESGKLRWAFVTDPYVEADVFVADEQQPGKGKLERGIVGEQYVEMVSDWWHSDPTQVCMGYAHADRGLVDGVYKGGACDNDVHEHFKCLEEVALTKAYVHEEDGKLIQYNCKVWREDSHIMVKVAESLVDEVVIYVEQSCEVTITDWKKTDSVSRGINSIQR
ncbi:MAG: hypothetical protein ACRCW2_07075 [Cellulosilyticaceae bacterium]